jgi:enterochelin esterase-like enzyme
MIVNGVTIAGRWLLRLGLLAGLASALLAALAPFPHSARAEGLAGPPGAAPAAAGGLQLLPPNEAPFDAGARRDLAMDALTYFARQQGTIAGRGVYQLPVAPWLDGSEAPSSRRVWEATVPGGLPIYLLADASESGELNPNQTSITVDGVSVSGLAAYVHGGVPALFGGRMRQYAVLDLVFAPPRPGRYRLEVRSRTGTLAPGEDDVTVPVSTRRAGADETLLVYDLTVQPADSLSPLLLRDDAGAIYALHGAERRRVPDLETLRLLGYAPETARPAGPGALAAIPEGPALPELREGMLVRSDPGGALFRLAGGRREWLRTPPDGAGSARLLEAPVLQTIPPLLANDLLLKGAAPDVYHVDRLSLRKIPDWKWVADRGLSADDLIYVPDRIIATLPQNAPHWRMPGGVSLDRSFYSTALGRTMPYRIYLPPSYDGAEKTGQRFPVIYLLHGLSGRYDEWSGYGVEEVANQLYTDGKLADVIIVMPQGGLGYWMNQDGGTLWADYVARDLVAHVDATYRTLPRREARAIGGLSMGGHGALQLALNYPEVFGVAGAHSPSLRGADSAPAYFGGEAGFARRDPISLVRQSQVANPPLIWIDVGQDDFWRSAAETLHQALLERGWAHEWRVYAGEHDGWYWGDHLWEYLPFYNAAFQRLGVPLTR